MIKAITDTEFLHWLIESGFKEPRAVDDQLWVAIKPFMFTHAIIIGEIGDRTGYLDRWCYKTHEAAKIALDAWDGIGEPTGWHRHPTSGRRVSDNPNTIDSRGQRVPVGQIYHYS